MKIREFMKDWVKVYPETNIAELAKVMDKYFTGSVLVEKGDKPLGVITERDILRKIVALGKNPKQTKVKHIMSSPVITIDVNEDIAKASEIMDKSRIRRLAVVENDKIVGKITANIISRNFRYLLGRDIVHYRPYYGKPGRR